MVPPLQPPDSLHLQAAHGWLELGNHIEADAELDKAKPGPRLHPNVVRERWEMCAAAKGWNAGLYIRIVLAVLVATIFSAGCSYNTRTAAFGKCVNGQQVQLIKDGKTTQAEIESWFGKPITTRRLAPKPNGAVIRWIWYYSGPTEFPFQVIATGQALFIDFDRNGTVVHHDFSERERK